MRNNEWLEKKFENIWETYFANVTRPNEIKIMFGRNARTRLGSIRLVGSRGLGVGGNAPHHTPHTLPSTPYSLITITGYFKDERVPEFMVDAVIAHELCHYAHGFSSTLPQLLRHPHLGGAVDREMIKRGLGDFLLQQRRWLKSEWKIIIGPVRRRRTVRRRKKMTLLQFLLNSR